jgi:hypothetical protein
MRSFMRPTVSVIMTRLELMAESVMALAATR